MKLDLSNDQSQIVQVYSALDQIGSGGGGSFQFSIDGKTFEINATPEVVQAFKQGLGAALVGQNSDSVKNLSFSKSDIAHRPTSCRGYRSGRAPASEPAPRPDAASRYIQSARRRPERAGVFVLRPCHLRQGLSRFTSYTVARDRRPLDT